MSSLIWRFGLLFYSVSFYSKKLRCHYHLQCFLYFFYASYLKLHMSIFANNFFIPPHCTSQSVIPSFSSFAHVSGNFYYTELSDVFFDLQYNPRNRKKNVLINRHFQLKNNFPWHAIMSQFYLLFKDDWDTIDCDVYVG